MAASHLLWVDAWDGEADEAMGGGRTLDTSDSLAEACDLVLLHEPLARRMYGPGQLVVTDHEHRRIDPWAERFHHSRSRVAVG